jgi:starch synthase
MALEPPQEETLSPVAPTQRRTRQRRATPTPARGHSPASPLTRPDGSAAPVVHLVPELSPYARTGGLGEAVSSLAKHQAASGIPVIVFVPLYGVIRERTELRPVGPAFAVNVGPRIETARLYEPAGALTPGCPRVIFVESAEYFDRPGLYGDDDGDYPDNAQRYAFFSRAVLVALPRVLTQPPSILHSHDWQTALASEYLKSDFQTNPY